MRFTLLILLIFTIVQTNAAINKWTGLAGTNEWSNSGNWSENHKPEINDDVLVTNNSITVILSDTFIAIHSLTLKHGSISSEGLNCTFNISQTVVLDSTSELNMITGNLNIRGDLLNSGSLSAPTSYFYLGGDFTNLGLFNNNGGTVILNGTKSQILKGLNVITFHNLTLNNKHGFILYTPISVKHELKFLNGIMTTSSEALVHLTNGAYVTPTGGAHTSFIYGPMERTGTTAFVFPVGGASSLGKIGIGKTNKPTTFIAHHIEEKFNNTSSFEEKGRQIEKVNEYEYWTITRTLGYENATVTLFWDEDDDEIGECGEDRLCIAHWNGKAWECTDDSVIINTLPKEAGGSVSTSTPIIVSNAFTFACLKQSRKISVFTLVSFEAGYNNHTVHLKWLTEGEVKTDYFEVERSVDGETWNGIGSVIGDGKIAGFHYYEFTDIQPNPSMKYYRLKHVNLSGLSQYFSVVSVDNYVNTEQRDKIKLYPNPCQSIVYISLSADADEVKYIEVYNAIGNKVYAAPNVSNSIDLSDLPSGFYYAHLKTDYVTTIKNIILRK